MHIAAAEQLRVTTTQQLLSHTTRQECVAIRRSSPVPQAWELLWRATYGGGVRCQRRVMASSDRRRTGGAGRRPPRTKFFLTQAAKKASQQGPRRRSGRRTTRVLELYPRSYWSPSNNYTGTGDPGRSAVRAHGCPAHPPAIRAACACLSLVLPGAQAHAAMQRRGGVEGGGPRTEQRRNHTSRQDRPPHRIALARRGLSAPPSPCRAALLLR